MTETTEDHGNLPLYSHKERILLAPVMVAAVANNKRDDSNPDLQCDIRLETHSSLITIAPDDLLASSGVASPFSDDIVELLQKYGAS
jgi:hypothetical protein